MKVIKRVKDRDVVFGTQNRFDKDWIFIELLPTVTIETQSFSYYGRDFNLTICWLFFGIQLYVSSTNQDRDFNI